MGIDYSVFTFSKTGQGTKADRAEKADDVRKHEVSHKQQVRRADRYCRFPRCGCGRHNYALAVAHLEHKGAGGNPLGDRSEVDRMILLCAPRHRENPVSLDRETVHVHPLTAAGTRGPCRFSVYTPACKLKVGTTIETWFVVATETAPHLFEPFTEEQLAILNHLRAMKR